jgi:hypothetical protein
MKIRRYDLDWIRIIVFGLLILYHIALVFVPWNYHIKNNELTTSLQIPMMFLSAWRLPALFVISGMGTRFALSFRTGKEFTRERFVRLIIPLIFGILVIISPQIYYERLAQGQQYTNFIDFYPDFFQGIYPRGNFSWNHLWFLPYLFTYSLILLPLFLFIRKNPDSRFLIFIRNISSKPWGLFLYIIPLLFVVSTLGAYFPVTRNLYYDWYAFTHYLLFFLYGFLFISINDIFWENLDRVKFTALIIGVLSFPLWLILSNEWYGTIFKTVNTWCWILVVFGYGAKYLNKSSKPLRYLNRAVYPFYILHQTLIIIVAFYIRNLELSILIKFILLSLATFIGSWLLYEFIIKRIKITRILFGLKNST